MGGGVVARMYHEPHADCVRCGFTFPVSQLTRELRTNKLVDWKCYDAPSAGDERAWRRLASESGQRSPQPVQDQGFQGYDEDKFDGTAGASEGGADWGGAGDDDR